MNARNHPKSAAEAISGGFVAEASKVTPRQFLQAIGLSSPEKRAEDRANLRADCIRAINRGDVRGYPAVLIHQLRAEMQAEEDALALAPVERIAPGQVLA